MDFVDMKWASSAPKHRKNTAEALTTITFSFIKPARGRPTDQEIRSTLYKWAFNKDRRSNNVMPEDSRRILEWLQLHTVDVRDLDDAALMRNALDALSLRIDGKSAAASTIARKRTALSSVLKYAVELRLLDSHPLAHLTWKAPKGTDGIDRRTVVNPQQALDLLAAVEVIAPELTAFFGCMYYSALRPEEVLHLKDSEFERPTKGTEWGWLNLTGATVAIGEDWSGGSTPTEDRSLKHRGKSATRRVPVPPPLVQLLVDHLKRYGSGKDGRIFVTQRGPTGRYRPSHGQPISNNAYTRVWKKARAAALTPQQVASPLARVPYHLRHAAVSLWLNAGVPATQVAEWAGHSVAVLLKVYAQCIDGAEQSAQARIGTALTESGS
jgi:integrase